MLQLHPNDQQFNGLLGVTYMRDLTVALQPITTVNRQTSNINNTLGLCKHDFHILRWISCFHNNALYKGTGKTCVADYVRAQLNWLDTNCHSSFSPTTNAWPTLRYVGRTDAITKPFCGQEVCVKACLTSMTPLNMGVSRVHNTIRTVYKVIEPYLERLQNQIIISSLW